jgi:hypothetical protein
LPTRKLSDACCEAAVVVGSKPGPATSGGDDDIAPTLDKFDVPKAKQRACSS